MGKDERENKDDSPISVWTTKRMMVPFSEMRKPKEKLGLRIRTRNCAKEMLTVLSLVVEFLPHQIYILSPILSSEIQTNSTCTFTPVDIST